MKVQVIFTLNELKKITPSLTKEHLISDKPHIKEILKEYFWRLGCTIPDKFEIEEGLITKNRYGELDSSLRIIVYERNDPEYMKSKYASHQVRVATNDVSLLRDIDSLTNQRSFDVGNGIEAV